MDGSSWSNSSTGIAESYRALRTSLLAPSRRQLPKTIVVTSALPKEGKTTTSLNLAATLARHGARVLLVEADLRQASLAAKLGIDSPRGLTSVLTSEAAPEDCVLGVNALPGLSVMLSGPKQPNPGELLASQKFSDSMRALAESFDTVIIDTPPVLAVTDPVIASIGSDCVLLVAKYGATPTQSLIRARDVLRRANASLWGIVVNCIDLESPQYQYYAKAVTRYFQERES
jgi:capsular exopolysaccharide synthesis family protein